MEPAGISMTAPTLPAYRTPDGSVAVCDHCRRWDWHGRCEGNCTPERSNGRMPKQGDPCLCPLGSGNGHRVAHCHCRESQYDHGGYTLVEVGDFTPAVEALLKLAERDERWHVWAGRDYTRRPRGQQAA